MRDRALVGWLVSAAVASIAAGAIVATSIADVACNALYVARFPPTAITAVRMIAGPREVAVFVPAIFLLTAGAFAASRARAPRWLRLASLCVPGGALASAAALSTPAPVWTARTTDCDGVARYRAGTFDVPGGGTEPAYHVDIGEDGLRTPTLDPDDPRPRVLLVGDSWTFGAGLDEGSTLAGQLGRLRPDLAFVNAGLEGDNLPGMLARAAVWASRLQPQYLVVFAGQGDLEQPVATTDICSMPAACRARIDINHHELDFAPAAVARTNDLAQDLAESFRGAAPPLLVSLFEADPRWAERTVLPSLGWEVSVPGCYRPENLFGPASHPNARGVGCYAAAVARWLPPPVGDDPAGATPESVGPRSGSGDGG
ncbi:MAG: hypothetical protein H6697_11275 [Myxococcales bacterium]|nr:hypothetical protein [Myxococcales bacterium]MCB9521283.1 hypothetical protein [Myxococcales bacterium]